MEEKERYVCKKISKDYLFPEILCELKDTESKFFVVLESKDDAVKIADLLNQQDKRIKELELLLNADKKIKTNSIKGFEKLKAEIKQLKQSQKKLAIEKLETLKNSLIIFQQAYSDTSLTINFVEQIINNQIKELGGGENE